MLFLNFQFFLKTVDELKEARENFIAQWGAMGTAWGINKAMAQIHALLMVATEPLNTDDIMEQLGISRGNANTNLWKLVDWGLVRKIFLKGERKDYFESEKDVWKMFCCIARERKRRELEPILDALGHCTEKTAELKTPEAEAFNHMVSELHDFASLVAGALDKIGRSEKSVILQTILRLLK